MPIDIIDVDLLCVLEELVYDVMAFFLELCRVHLLEVHNAPIVLPAFK